MLEISEVVPQYALRPRTALVLDGEAPISVAVKATGRCRQTLVKYIRQGRIQGRKIGGRWWVNLDSIKLVEA